MKYRVSPMRVAFVVASVVGSLTACTAILGLNEKPLEVDAAGLCEADDAGFNDLKEPACWETYKVPSTLVEHPGFLGGAFDGRYLYFVSAEANVVLRYDSTSVFSDDTAWTAFGTSSLPNAAGGTYAGAVFDGRYLYVVPSSVDTPFLQYDTKTAFSEDSSWKSYTANIMNTTAYYGGTFDGRYLYFAPSTDEDGNESGVVERYDTTLGFTADAAWTWVNLPTLPGEPLAPKAVGFFGAVFDGQYVYLVPQGYPADGFPGTVVPRYDTTADFKAPASWELFDTSTLGSGVGGFESGIFDGSYVYLIPYYAGGNAARLDISGKFTAKSSWTTATPDPGAGSNGGDVPTFGTGAFDGRFLYLSPSIEDDGGENGLLARESADAGAFIGSTPWETFDTTTLHAATFGASVFDGQYLYLAPLVGGTFARFETKQANLQPKLPHYFGSFF
jgi:hypothetical protein